MGQIFDKLAGGSSCFIVMYVLPVSPGYESPVFMVPKVLWTAISRAFWRRTARPKKNQDQSLVSVQFHMPSASLLLNVTFVLQVSCTERLLHS